ncbi:MAG: hypothetical protein KDA84_03265 [Planctomycetaceae bacterium]|nr:hypothetical protein [Planctomycetaceae bacterium]
MNSYLVAVLFVSGIGASEIPFHHTAVVHVSSQQVEQQAEVDRAAEIRRCRQLIQRLEAQNSALDREITKLDQRIQEVQDMIDAGLRRDPPMPSAILISLKARLTGQRVRWKQQIQSNAASIQRLKTHIQSLQNSLFA